jgi:hypothetical protein
VKENCQIYTEDQRAKKHREITETRRPHG